MTNGHACYLELAEAKFYILFIEYRPSNYLQKTLDSIVANLIFIIVCVLVLHFQSILIHILSSL